MSLSHDTVRNAGCGCIVVAVGRIRRPQNERRNKLKEKEGRKFWTDETTDGEDEDEEEGGESNSITFEASNFG